MNALLQFGEDLLQKHKIDSQKKDAAFAKRFLDQLPTIEELFNYIYGDHPNRNQCFDLLLIGLIKNYQERSTTLLKKDEAKAKKGNWFLSNQITGMSLYVDRFAGSLKGLAEKLNYFDELGVNFLHLMPVFESPEGESDGGYAVSNFRKVDARFGTNEDLNALIKKMNANNMYLMLDIVLNHTSHHHEWAQKAKAGDKYYQDFFYFYDHRGIPDQLDQTMPEIFPESSPGSFTYIEACNKWVMTVFHHYQWDLNYTNPAVLVAMLDNVLHYGNLGVDILRIDAPAFIWKELGTTCQNLPKAHTLLRLIKQCVMVATPGMALLGEAIVAPDEIIKYFGTDNYLARECDVAYNATQMALQWDALSTGDTRVMLSAQHPILQKPYGCTWISYTRCHDDIGLGYDDYMIERAGFNPYQHRTYLKNYFAGWHEGSVAAGAVANWSPADANSAMTDEGNNIWSITVTYPVASLGATQFYKFVNGDWGANEGTDAANTIAVDSCGVDDGAGNINRTYALMPGTVCYVWDACDACGVSVAENAIADLTVAPNPASDVVNFSFEANNAATATDRKSVV